MLILDCEQLSEEWYAARVGIPTASNFDKIVTSKGESSKQATKYMYQLAGERITGKKEDSYTNAAMERGIVLESEARSLVFASNGLLMLTKWGFCLKNDRTAGASPDGLVQNGGIEIKCPYNGSTCRLFA